MDLEVHLGKKEGRTGMLIIILMIVFIFIGIVLYVAKVNMFLIIVIEAIVNIAAIRYLYFLFGNKKIIYFKDDCLVVDNPLLPRKKIQTSAIIEFHSHLINRYYGFLSVKYFKGDSICEVLLGGDIFEYDLAKLPTLLNSKANRYNQLTKNRYNQLKDKSAAIGLFALSNKTLVIIVAICFPLMLFISIFLVQNDIISNYLYYGIMGFVYFIVALLYFIHILPNIIFQYFYQYYIYSIIFSIVFYGITYLSKLII